MTVTDPTIVEPWVPTDSFGNRLAQLRQQLRWNVKQAAKACDLDDQSWRNWEHGASPRDIMATATKIADATGCSYQWLVLGTQKRKLLNPADLRVVPDPPGQLSFHFPRSTAGDRHATRGGRHLAVVQ